MCQTSLNVMGQLYLGYQSRNMQVFNLDIDVESFWINFSDLKGSMEIPLPLDCIHYKCKKCSKQLSLPKNGELYMDEVEDPISAILTREKEKLEEEHLRSCDNGLLKMDEEVGLPENILLFLRKNTVEVITSFKIAAEEYKPIIVVKSCTVLHNPVMVLYQRDGSKNFTYPRLISKNFESILNVYSHQEDHSELDRVIDEESALCLQHDLPRLTGGGRKILQDFRYICQWCSPETLAKKNRGRFRELRNYRDHFRKYHEDTVPFSEFLNKVERNDPTWFCKLCRQKISLGNQLRHQIICRPPRYLFKKAKRGEKLSESSSSSEDTASTSKKKSEDDTRDPEDGDESKEEILSQSSDDVVPPKRSKGNKIASDEEEDESLLERGISDFLQRPGFSKIIVDAVVRCMKVEASKVIPIPDQSSVSTGPPIPTDGPGPSGLQNKIPEPTKRTSSSSVPTSEEELDVHGVHDVYEFVSESSSEKREEDCDDDGEEEEEEIEGCVKWWMAIKEKNLYKTEAECPLPIFLDTDEQEFKDTIIENYKIHQKKKEVLDREIEELESGDAINHQFNEDDQLYLDQFNEYVKNSSTKDILNIFSSEYEMYGIQKGAKATTAQQYSYRIVEFFNFLSQRFKGFHLSWFFDYRQELAKRTIDGELTFDYFLPSKRTVTEFIKSFKYGSNPAANCGIRMFALKKLFEMLKKEYEENVDCFQGSFVQRKETVEALVSKLRSLNDDICPSGAIKHISIASNKNHRRILAEQVKKCPEKSLEKVMNGVSEYLLSSEYYYEKKILFKLAYEKEKKPTAREYIGSTNWVLEQLICIGGNRPCSLLGLTVGDWQNRKEGFCPFNQTEDNDMIVEDEEYDSRKILKNPYQKPQGSDKDEPTGIIVESKSDKVAIGPPCYIWLPKELEDLVQAHSMMASKYFGQRTDVTHPHTILFLNSKGTSIKQIECKHFKDYIGLPITAYDFRRSLSTFCFESKNEDIRRAEPSILRHRRETGYAFYFQKHSENVEYVNVQYAMKHGLTTASEDEVSDYFAKMKQQSADQEWELDQKRNDKAAALSRQIVAMEEKSMNDAKKKTGRYWLLPNEYKDFIDAVDILIQTVTEWQAEGNCSDYDQMLLYVPGATNGGYFPPNKIWWRDMCRILFGLTTVEGDKMRQAELDVYHGVPFAINSGRKKIQSVREKNQTNFEEYSIIGNYWRDKIREEVKNTMKKHEKKPRFVFNAAEWKYYQSF